MSGAGADGVRYRRVPAADELERDGELLVLVEDRAVRVAGLGPAILALLERPTGVEELSAALVRRFGDPGDAESWVRTALEELGAAGLVVADRVE